MPIQLSTNNHDRQLLGLRYIYPVMSRRAGGLSIGINFNPNNACNWRCLYCQVPDLKPGNAADMDFALLAKELRFFLDYVLQGSFFDDYQVAEPQRVIKDIAISGNGEPTSLKHFDQALLCIAETAESYAIFPASHFVLISNGSLIHQSQVQAGLQVLARFQGELWFKLDSASEAGRKLINNTGQTQPKLLQNLALAASCCNIKLQTCLFNYRQQVWTEAEKQAYLSLLRQLQAENIAVQEILLYAIARQSYQPEAAELQNMSLAEMQAFAEDIRGLGYEVSLSV